MTAEEPVAVDNTHDGESSLLKKGLIQWFQNWAFLHQDKVHN